MLGRLILDDLLGYISFRECVLVYKSYHFSSKGISWYIIQKEPPPLKGGLIYINQKNMNKKTVFVPKLTFMKFLITTTNIIYNNALSTSSLIKNDLSTVLSGLPTL